MQTPAIWEFISSEIFGEDLDKAYPLRQRLHVLWDKRVARRMVKHREAPRIPECDEVRLSGVKVNKQCLGRRPKLSYARELVDFPALASFQQAGPDQEASSISSLLKVGEQAVDDVRFGREEINGIHVGIRLASIFDLFDDYPER